MSMVYGIIAALDEEIRLLLENLDVREKKEVYGTTIFKGVLAGQEVVLCKCGPATINAALCTSVVIREFGAQAVINTGIAGALGEKVNMLDVVLSKDVAFYDRDTPILEKYYPFTTCFQADEGLLAKARAAAEGLVVGDVRIKPHVGRIVTGDFFVTDRARKQQIIEGYHPLCVEMEGAAIAHTAFMNGCPFVIIRTMSDNADENADVSYDNLIERASNIAASIVLKMLEG